ncbi:MAG: orotidine-5'-phosphate decarboxylase [Elusimicrobia bacterium]|nr:orotidine-5'-phosphate decarboxylase [Elusimicrobiota bacterium]
MTEKARGSKIIMALDVPCARAQELVRSSSDLISHYKIGPVLWFEWGAACLAFFRDCGAKLMIDFKFHDIPNTVKESIGALMRSPGSEAIWAVTLHSSGGYTMLKNAVMERDRHAAGSRPKLLGVTVLTSLEERDLYRIGINRAVPAQVKKLAMLAQDAGLDGVVASGHEIGTVRKACGEDFEIFVPGVRLQANPQKDLDQKRVMTPAQALREGASYVIAGRDLYGAENVRDQINVMIGAMGLGRR